MRRLAALAAVALLALTGCGGDDLDGTVTAKDVREGYTYLYMQPIYTSSCSGKPVVCTQRQSGSIPIYFHVPTCFKVTVDGAVSGDSCIDEKTWAATNVGDHYTGPDVDAKDRKVRAS